MKIAGTIILSYEDSSGVTYVLLVRDNPLTRGVQGDFTRPFRRIFNSDTPITEFKFPGGMIKGDENNQEKFRELRANPRFNVLIDWANEEKKQTYLSGAVRELEEETGVKIVNLEVGEGSFFRYHTKELVPDTTYGGTVDLHVYHCHLGRVPQSVINTLEQGVRVGRDIAALVWYPVNGIRLYDKGVEKVYSVVPVEGSVYRVNAELGGMMHSYYEPKTCVLEQSTRFVSILPLNAEWLKSAGMLRTCKTYLTSDILDEHEFERDPGSLDAKTNYEYFPALHVPTNTRYVLKYLNRNSELSAKKQNECVKKEFLAFAFYRLHGLYGKAAPHAKLVQTVRGCNIIAIPKEEFDLEIALVFETTPLLDLIGRINSSQLASRTDEQRRRCFFDCYFASDEEKQHLYKQIQIVVAAKTQVREKFPRDGDISVLPISEPKLGKSEKGVSKAEAITSGFIELSRDANIQDKAGLINRLISRDEEFASAYEVIAGHAEGFGNRYDRYKKLYFAILTANPGLFVQPETLQSATDDEWADELLAMTRQMESELSSLRVFLLGQSALIQGEYKVNDVDSSDKTTYDLNTCPLPSLYAVCNVESFVYFLQSLTSKDKEEYIGIIEKLQEILILQSRRIKKEHNWLKEHNKHSGKQASSNDFEKYFVTQDRLTLRLINFLGMQIKLLKGKYATENHQLIDIRSCTLERIRALFEADDIVYQFKVLAGYSEQLAVYGTLLRFLSSNVKDLLNHFEKVKNFLQELKKRIHDARNFVQLNSQLSEEVRRLKESTHDEDQALKGSLQKYSAEPVPPPVPPPVTPPVLPPDPSPAPPPPPAKGAKQLRELPSVYQIGGPQLPGLSYQKLSDDNSDLVQVVCHYLNEDRSIIQKAIDANEEYARQGINPITLSKILKQHIVLIGADGKPTNINSIDEILGTPIFVYDRGNNCYDAFSQKDSFSLDALLKHLFPKPVVIDPKPVVVPAPPKAPPPPPMKPKARLLALPVVEVPEKEPSHLILPVNLGTKKEERWVLLQFVASKIAEVEDSDIRKSVQRGVARKKIQQQNHYTDYGNLQMDALLKHALGRYRQVILMPAMTKKAFSKISSSKDLLGSNQDFHNRKELCLSYYDPIGSEVDLEIKAHLQKFGISVKRLEFKIPPQKHDLGLWVVEVAKALVHGRDGLAIKLTDIRADNELVFEEYGLRSPFTEDDDAFAEVDEFKQEKPSVGKQAGNQAAFWSPPLPAAIVPPPAAAGVGAPQSRTEGFAGNVVSTEDAPLNAPPPHP